MKKIFKLIFSLIICSSFISACGSIKDGFVGNKKNNSDEFLIEKKNPLVLPPKFGELPLPTSTVNKTNKEKKFDLQKLIDEKSGIKKSTSTSSTTGNSLEKSILEKIKNN